MGSHGPSGNLRVIFQGSIEGPRTPRSSGSESVTVGVTEEQKRLGSIVSGQLSPADA